MFNKKPRRNFRQRKGKSSDEDEQKSGEGDGSKIQATASSIKPSKLPQNRGISCSSKREAMPPNSDSSGAEDAVEYGTSGPFVGTNLPHSKEDKDGRKKKGNVLSFSNEKEDKAVVFQARRKEASPVKTSRPTARKDVTVVASPRERSGSDVSGEELSPESDGEGGAKSTTSSSASSMSSRSSRSSKSSTQKQKPVVIPDARRIQAARRQRQAARAQKDYISLGRDGESSPRTPDQDLEEHTEEDDDDDEPDDHECRIEFAPRSKTIRERIAEKMGGSDSGASESDEQEREDDNLWQEQQIGKGVKRHPGEQSPSGSEGSGSVRSGSSRRKQRVNIPECMPPVSLSMVKKRITGKLCDLREVHRAHEADLRRMEVDMDSSRTSLENLESGSSDRQLRFYRATNAYIQNLVECLREKVVEINSVEVDMHTLLSDQAEMPLIHKVKETQGKAESGEPGEEDYGSLPADSEPSPEEEAELQRERAEILSRSQDVFCDVQEDFWEVKKVLSRFSEWREAFSESYHSAYISLCLPKLLNPLIRHQLLGWNPLQAAGEDFEALPWFSAVETFCHGLGFVELVWDPLSSRQSVCLSELCCRLQDDYSLFEGEQSKPVKAFLEAVSGRLRSSVDDDVFIPLYPKKRQVLSTEEVPRPAVLDSCEGNVGQWDGLISEHVLKELMLDKLLNRYLMMTLLNETHSHDSVHKCKKVAVCFPKSWFKDVSSCPSQLKSFSDHLLQTAHSVCKQQPDHPNTRAVVSDLLTVLGSIQAWDKVETISDKYHYKDLVDTLNLS
ncbi:unnamed protein product [Coregonus sp. 'balchen']|nr:unnamed protein product [Coregonus sp. 'balchen']